MYAIVEIAGNQYRINPAEKIFVPKLEDEVGTTVKFENVLLVADENDIRIGTPFVKGATVSAKVLSHAKDDKVIVFKKKRRKGYRVKRGHRQQYTEIEITKIA